MITSVHGRGFILTGFLGFSLLLPLPSIQAQMSPSTVGSEGPEDVVRALYDLVTFPEGVTPDWDSARALFLGDAVVVLRTSRAENTVFSVEGWIQDFENFIQEAEVVNTGFTEEILRIHSTVFGDIAQVWVLYQAQIPGSPRPPQEGVDSFHLVRHEGRWLIASILNELPVLAGPVPEVLGGGGGD